MNKGIILKLDIEKVYFSPRLSNERLRISKLVKTTLILVMTLLMSYLSFFKVQVDFYMNTNFFMLLQVMSQHINLTILI